MRNEPKQIPVFLFTGFLEAGKTTFIQSSLDDSRFNDGENTLVIRCEEGEEEYDVSSFAAPNVFLRDVENEEDLDEATFAAWLKETGSTRVIVEYNGMWKLQSLFDTLPDNWIIAQEICFAEASTYPVFNANMRNLVFDKLTTCEVIVFNRCSDNTDTDALHKIVRQANRRCNIFYEYPDGRSIHDTKEDPLPFDMNAPIVEIADRDYAYFFADIMENPEQYTGKTVSFTGLCPESARPTPGNMFVAGRMLMNCCAADTQFAGLACFVTGLSASKPAPGSWVKLTGKVRVQRNKMFSGKIPVIDVTGTDQAVEPEDPVATFY